MAVSMYIWLCLSFPSFPLLFFGGVLDVSGCGFWGGEGGDVLLLSLFNFMMRKTRKTRRMRRRRQRGWGCWGDTCWEVGCEERKGERQKGMERGSEDRVLKPGYRMKVF